MLRSRVQLRPFAVGTFGAIKKKKGLLSGLKPHLFVIDNIFRRQWSIQNPMNHFAAAYTPNNRYFRVPFCGNHRVISSTSGGTRTAIRPCPFNNLTESFGGSGVTRPFVPRTTFPPQPLKNAQSTCFSRDVTRDIAPGTAGRSCPLKTIQVTFRCSLVARRLVPGATVLVRPLKNV